MNSITLQDDQGTSFLLRGSFAPQQQETTSYNLPVEGRIPEELSGQYVVNGPNYPLPVKLPFHLFRGDGMLHGVDLRGGRARRYHNRWVRTVSLADQFGLPQPRRSQKNMDWTEKKARNVASTHIIQHAGRLLALFEMGLPYELTMDLDTIGEYDFSGELLFPMTAHPKIDPNTGELLFFSHTWIPPKLVFHVADVNGVLVRSEQIDLPGAPTFFHDFAITPEHVIFYDLPVVFDVNSTAHPSAFPYRWNPKHGARVGLMPRRPGGGAQMRWYDVELCNVMHPMNAYEDGDRTVVDVVRWPQMQVQPDEKGVFTEGPTTLDRWTIDRTAGRVIEERLDDHCVEFPRVNERLIGQRYRYGYAVEMHYSEGYTETGNLLQYDLVRGEVQTHNFGPGHSAREGVFVPYGDGETDGWVLSYVYDHARDASDLVILNAADFAGTPVATIKLPSRIPFGFHGSWVSTAEGA